MRSAYAPKGSAYAQNLLKISDEIASAYTPIGIVYAPN
jgi:hypothetical protein